MQLFDYTDSTGSSVQVSIVQPLIDSNPQDVISPPSTNSDILSLDSKKLVKLDGASLAHLGTLELTNLADKQRSLMIIPQTTLMIMGSKAQELGIMDYT